MNPGETQQAPGPRLGLVGGLFAIVAAALAMALTLPGRTHGLGLITTRLLEEFSSLSPARFSTINLVATLLGSLFCLPCGWLLDRFRARDVALAVTLALGGAVLWLSVARNETELALAITLTRGIGQSMLSVVSLAIIGKSFPRRPGMVMGAYAVLLTMLMATSTGLLASRVATIGWRSSWWEMGLVVLGAAPLLALVTPWILGSRGFLPQTPENASELAARAERPNATLRQALVTPCFWVFALSTSFFGLVSSGNSLFQQSIFAAYGLDEKFYHLALVSGLGIGLASNLVGGGLAYFVPLNRLLGVALVLLGAALAGLPFVNSPETAWLFVATYGVAGGWITVLFFTIWGQAFGSRWLGRIQGAAQMLTVIASAVGPLAVTYGAAALGGYHGPLFGFSAVSMLLAAAAFFTLVPSATRSHKELAS